MVFLKIGVPIHLLITTTAVGLIPLLWPF